MTDFSLQLETERLLLRPATLDDAEFFYRIMNTEGWLEHIGDRGIRSIEDAKKHIHDNVWQSYQDRNIGMMVVCNNTPELQSNEALEPIGLCGLLRRPSLEHFDIGYAFLPTAGGKGYAIEAAKSIYQYGKDTLGIDTIVAITSPENERSGRLLEKLGMRFQKEITLSDSGEKARYYL